MDTLGNADASRQERAGCLVALVAGAVFAATKPAPAPHEDAGQPLEVPSHHHLAHEAVKRRRQRLASAQPSPWRTTMATYEGNEAAEITPQEENQLRRVHRLLCDYGAKKKVLKLLRPKQDQLEKLRQSADDEQADILVASEIQSLETDVEKLRQDSSRTKYLNAEQALAYGIVDKVLRSEDDLPAKPTFLAAL